MAVATVLRVDQHGHRRIHAQCHHKDQPLRKAVHPDLAQHRIEIGLRQRGRRLHASYWRCLDQGQLLHRIELEESRARHAEIAHEREHQHDVADHKVHERRRRGRGAKCERYDFGECGKDAAKRLTAHQSGDVLGRELTRNAEQAAAKDGSSD